MVKISDQPQKIDHQLYTVLPDQQKAGYDQKARIYENLVGSYWYNKILWGTRPQDYKDFAKHTITNNQGSLLDLGCGGLSQTASLYAQCRNEIYLVDASLEMLKIGKQRIENELTTIPDNIYLLQADAFNLPFPDQSFENLVSFGMLHLFENKSGFVEEALRVLKPNGRFALTGLTTDRPISRKYMQLLWKQGEFGTPKDSTTLVALFKDQVQALQHYRKGSMVFIKGHK